VLSGGSVFKKSETGSIITLGTELFLSGVRPTFADFGDTLYAANGSGIIKITTSTASILSDVDIPANVSHVTAFDTYLLANKGGSGQMHRSDVLAPETWSANSITAEQDPDNLVAIHVRSSEIWLFGERTIERWYNDGETPFVPIQGGILSTGCQAPYTIQWIRGAFYWLNERRELVRSSGGQYEIISTPVNDQLQIARTISNAFADYITVGGNNFYVLTLPDYSDYGITLVYDIKKDEWQGRWNYWNSSNNRYERFRGQCYAFVPSWNKHILGDKINGLLYTMSLDTYKDNTEILRSAWLTGYIDHKTGSRKRSLELRFRLLRGHGGTDTNPRLMLRWRDDGSQIWSNTHYIELGEIGQYEFYKSIRRLGMYRSRQYELSVTDDVPVVVADAEELVEVIPR